MNNLDIRLLVLNNGLRYKDIAKQLGISREWLSKLLRKELSSDNKIRIMRAIGRLCEEKGGNVSCLNDGK